MLTFHISVGWFVLLAGMLALVSTKGAALHKKTGKVFVIAMLLVCISAAYLDLSTGHFPVMALLAMYFASTSWATIKHKPNSVSVFDVCAFFGIAMLAITFFKWGWEITFQGKTNDIAMPAFMYFVWGSFAALAALLDLNMILHKGHSGAHRIIRHVWRMCFALLMAIMSFLSQDIFPSFILQSGLLWSPIALILLTMSYWILRLLINRKRHQNLI